MSTIRANAIVDASGGNTATINGITPINTASVLSTFNASGSAPVYACRAWVNFNGTGTVAIRAAGNVTSITDNGVGDYTVNITTAIQDADYCVVTAQKVTNTTGLAAEEAPAQPWSLATGSFRIFCNDDQVLTDSALVYAAVFR